MVNFFIVSLLHCSIVPLRLLFYC